MFMKHMWHLETVLIAAPFHLKYDYSMVAMVTDHLHSANPAWYLHKTTNCKGYSYLPNKPGLTNIMEDDNISALYKNW